MNSKFQLEPGKVSECQCILLMEISNIRSSRIKKALRDYFVEGHSVDYVCQKNFIERGYFYRKLKIFRSLHDKIILLRNCY